MVRTPVFLFRRSRPQARRAYCVLSPDGEDQHVGLLVVIGEPLVRVEVLSGMELRL